MSDYLFDIRAVTDERPYFHRFLKRDSLSELSDTLGGLTPAFQETGQLILTATLVQVTALAVVMIVLPLVGGVKTLRAAKGKGPTLAYFLLLGLGFMLLEMGFLQKFILYLSAPIYSAAVVISSFLVFAGVGSLASARWRGRSKHVMLLAASGIVVLAGVYIAGLNSWLALTQGCALWTRCLTASATIAPLAFLMGHMFPTGLGQVSSAQPAIVPWAWAVNGFASVTATIGAPLLAMSLGFSRVVLIAVLCYALAGMIATRLPEGSGNNQ